MAHFTALILAAGVGSRLAPLTDHLPKSMVPVNGKPILFQQLDSLLSCGIEDTIIITGYQHEILETQVSQAYPGVRFIHSQDYASTNNMVSAYLSRNALEGSPFLMMNADVFFDSSALAALLGNPAPNAIITDLQTYNPESMKVTGSLDRITHISKDIPQDQALGTSIDVYKFSQEGAQDFFQRCDYYIEHLGQRNRWSEVALNDILETTTFAACPLQGRWLEIDTLDDLRAAELLFSH